jgi:hypothetical protein
MLEPLKKHLAFLVRVKEVEVLRGETPGGEVREEWEEDELDGRPIFLDVSGGLLPADELARKRRGKA